MCSEAATHEVEGETGAGKEGSKQEVKQQSEAAQEGGEDEGEKKKKRKRIGFHDKRVSMLSIL